MTVGSLFAFSMNDMTVNKLGHNLYRIGMTENKLGPYLYRIVMTVNKLGKFFLLSLNVSQQILPLFVSIA